MTSGGKTGTGKLVELVGVNKANVDSSGVATFSAVKKSTPEKNIYEFEVSEPLEPMPDL